ncbi:hypothetical protein WJX75_007501 [Coccomyxa subellipsoidea]|uniref:Uncharacterized protein n=1 Tax=Coccomyxa subellipsoidea TaxID=248742 RepID=A0ABR2YJQ4_9CHLO
MEALADQAASSDAAPSTEMSLDQQSKLQADEQHFAQELTAVKAQIEQINLAMVSEAAKFGAALSGLSGAQSSMAATVESMQGQLGHAAGELGQLSAAVKEAKAAAANARQHASSSVEGVQAQVGAWTSSMEALGADHELAAQETSKALKMLARINADNKAMQHAQLDLVTDCASQQAAITQLQAAGASTTANTGTLAARLDKLALEAAEWKSQADAATAGVKCLADQMAQLEAAAAQTRKQLAAAEQQADARIKNQEAELHLLQETLLELGTAARAVLSDHAQQLGRLAQLPAQVAGLSEQLLSTQQAEVSAIAQQDEAVDSRLGAAEVQLECVEQVLRTVSTLEGRMRVVECTVADALEEEAAQMMALQEAIAKQAARTAALQAAGCSQNSQDTGSSATTMQVAPQAASSPVSSQPASLPSAADRGRQQRQRLHLFAQRSRATRKSGSLG